MVRGLCVLGMGDDSLPHRLVVDDVLDCRTGASAHQQLEVAEFGSAVSLVPLSVACGAHLSLSISQPMFTMAGIQY